MAHCKNHDRKWAILNLIMEEKPLSELFPPSTEEEQKYYQIDKKYYDELKKMHQQDKRLYLFL